MTTYSPCAARDCVGIVVTPTGYCIAHATKGQAEHIWQSFRSNRVLSFRGVTIGADLAERIGHELRMSPDGNVLADFRAACFVDDVDFGELRFGGRSDLIGAIFRGRTNMRLVKFGGYVEFDGATFIGDADFAGTEFLVGGSFQGARFQGECDFARANVGADLSFSGAKGPSG